MTNQPANSDLIALHSVINEGKTDVSLTVNPLAQHIDLRIISASKGKVSMLANINSTYEQGNGVIQGGALGIMLDFGLAFAGLSVVTLNQNVSTTNMNINFMRPGFPGQYRIDAEIERAGRSIIFAHAHLFNSDDKMVASATSSLMVRN